jgi:hypothetical protein
MSAYEITDRSVKAAVFVRFVRPAPDTTHPASGETSARETRQDSQMNRVNFGE